MTTIPGSEELARHLIGRRHLVHPSRRKLQAWLDGEATDIDHHLATCTRCADRLDDNLRPTSPISEMLLAALAPPVDLQPRVRSGIASRMQNRDDLALLGSMLSVAWETVKTLTETSDDSGDLRK